MKIVFINSCPYLGGAELWHLRTAKALRERGHQVAMMLRPGALVQKAGEADLPIVELPMLSDGDLYSTALAFAWFRREQPDLVLLNDQRECRIIAPAAMAAGVRVRVQRKGWPFLKGSWRDRIVYRWFVNHLIANSTAVADIFRKKSGLPAERIRVFHNGVELAGFQNRDREEWRERLKASPDEIMIGSAGRLVTQKGFDVLILALSMLAEEGLRPRAVIAGKGPEEQLLRKMADDAGVGGQVIMPGHVDDVPALLAALDVFVFPSRMEGRSNALAEAMATGLPIIATNISGNDELIRDGETGILTPVEDPRAIARAIRRCIDDREFAAKLGRAARRWARENLDAEKITDELVSFLEGLLDRAGSGDRPMRGADR